MNITVINFQQVSLVRAVDTAIRSTHKYNSFPLSQTRVWVTRSPWKTNPTPDNRQQAVMLSPQIVLVLEWM
jgi:hypothetical protein